MPSFGFVGIGAVFRHGRRLATWLAIACALGSRDQGVSMIRFGMMTAMAWMGMANLAASHPHVFVDTGIEVIFDDQGRAEALRLTWAYDDFFSMLILEDRAMDPDFDGLLTAEETAAIQGFDMAWDAGYPGDTYALLGGQSLSLSGPSDWTTTYVDGRLTSTHLRRFADPVVIADQPLLVQVYDSSFYTAYTIAKDTVLTGGPDCTAQNFAPNREAADAQLLASMNELAGSPDVEGEFPAIGAAYAEEARITCAARS